MQENRGPVLAFFLLPRRAMKLIDSRRSAVAMSLALALVGGSFSACNDSGVVGAPVAESPTPTPTATPGAPQAPIAIIESGSPIYSTLDDATFDGYFSYDPDGYVVSYAWQVVTAPAGSTSAMVPDAFDGSTSSLYLDLPGTYTIKLTVTDNDGLTGSETYSLDATVSAFHVQLAWPGQYTMADMDLHIVSMIATNGVAAMWDNTNDCHYRNCKPSFGQSLDWGTAGDATDNPRLDIDNIYSAVPENTNIETPKDGTYRVMVHYYGSSSVPTVDATVNIYLSGATIPTMSFSEPMTAIDQVWTVADIVWANGSGTIMTINSNGTTTGP